MSDLTPDAACDAFRAVTALAEWTKRRFAAYVRTRLPKQKKLIAQTRASAPEPDSMEAVIPAIVENGFFKMLRLKVEMDRLPASGPAVKVDDLYFCAGVLVAVFAADLEEKGMLDEGAVERAKKWRAKGLKPKEGAFQAALRQAFDAAGANAVMAEMIAPLITAIVGVQSCLCFPSSSGSPKAELTRIAGHLEAVRQRHGVTDGQLFARDDLMRELIGRIGTRAEFEESIDKHLFSAGADRLDETGERARESMQALVAFAPEASDDVEKVFERLGNLRTDDRVQRIAYGAFLRTEADAIWGKTAD